MAAESLRCASSEMAAAAKVVGEGADLGGPQRGNCDLKGDEPVPQEPLSLMKSLMGVQPTKTRKQLVSLPIPPIEDFVPLVDGTNFEETIPGRNKEHVIRDEDSRAS